MTESRRPAPWLMGLIIAAVLTVVTLLILAALGYGDDPVVETLVASIS